jgi:hypothetical protein
MNETECTNPRGLSCNALVAAVAKVSYQRFRDARVLFDPIIREATLIRMQELGMDMSRRFDRPEDAIHYFTEFTPDVHDFCITTAPGGAVRLEIGSTCPFRDACQIVDKKIGMVKGCAEAIVLLQVIECVCSQSESLTYDFRHAQRPGQACTIHIGTVEQIVLNQESQGLYAD